MAPPVPEAVNKSKVTVTGGIFRERTELNRRCLMEPDTACLMQNFCIEAGIGLE